MNNVQQEEKAITVNAKVTERQGMQIRLNFSSSIRDKNPLVMVSKMMESQENRTLNMEVRKNTGWSGITMCMQKESWTVFSPGQMKP